MKVMLVNPPWYRLQGADFPEIPLGICSIASFIKSKGCEVKVYNADFGRGISFSYSDLYDNFNNYISILNNLEHPLWKEVIDKIVQFEPEVVGISLKTGSYRSGCNIAQLIKRFNKNIVVLAGGVHPTLLPKDVASLGYFDYVVKGEGEETTWELLEVIKKGQTPNQIKGVTFRYQDQIIDNSNRDFIKDLDSLPFVEREDIVDRELYPADALSLLMTARGCPHSCTFCASERIWLRKVRFRSAKNVVDEIKLVKDRFNSKHFKIRDDLFTMQKKRVIEIFDRLEKDRIDITWQCEVRADSIDEDIVKRMRKAGCVGVNIGIESGSERILAEIKKGETTFQMSRAIKLLKRYGINVGAFVMIGFLNETKEDIKQTLDFVRRVEPDHVISSILTPYPGTEVYNQALKDGLITLDNQWESFFHQSPKMGLARNKEEFASLAKDVLEYISNYNNNNFRKFKRKFFQTIQNPKAIALSLRSLKRKLLKI